MFNGTYPNIFFVRSKTKRFAYKFHNNIPFGVFETTKLMDFSIKACDISMVDLNWSLSSNITIFTSAFGLHWLCDKALFFTPSNFIINTYRSAAKRTWVYLCQCFKVSENKLCFHRSFIRESTKFFVSYKNSNIMTVCSCHVM